MEKVLLKTEADFVFWRDCLKKQSDWTILPPDKYHAVLAYTIRDIPQGWDLVYEYIYLSDFEE